MKTTYRIVRVIVWKQLT